MKVEIHLSGPNATAWFNGALANYYAAIEADNKYYEQRHRGEFGSGAPLTGAATPTSSEDYIAEAQAANPQPAETEKPKRTRKAKEEPAPTVELETAQITTNPEDWKPVEEIEEAEIVDVFEEAAPAKVYTRQDVKDAMQVYVAKHGMDKLAANAADLLGAPKLSAIPEDAAAFEAAVKRLDAAVG